MKFRLEDMDEFELIGFTREFSNDNSYQEIPKFWDDVYQEYGSEYIFAEAINDYRIGEYGVCLDELGEDGKFTYMVAGKYEGGTIPKGLSIIKMPKMTWAKFTCIGPIPKALQDVNTKIFTEWLPQNEIYELTKRCSIEWYSDGDSQSNDYVSEIWIPVRRK